MQRLFQTRAPTLTLSQVLGETHHANGEANVAAAPPPEISGPTLAEERQAVLEQARLEGLCKGEAEATSKMKEHLREQAAVLDAAHEARMQAVAEKQRLFDVLLRSLPEALESIEARTLEEAAVLAFTAVTRMYGPSAAAGVDFSQLCARLLDEHRERPVVLRVAPSMYALVEDLGDPHVRVESAPGLAPGQAQLKTTTGITDGGVEVRLDAIRAAFLAGLVGQPT